MIEDAKDIVEDLLHTPVITQKISQDLVSPNIYGHQYVYVVNTHAHKNTRTLFKNLCHYKIGWYSLLYLFSSTDQGILYVNLIFKIPCISEWSFCIVMDVNLDLKILLKLGSTLSTKNWFCLYHTIQSSALSIATQPIHLPLFGRLIFYNKDKFLC